MKANKKIRLGLYQVYWNSGGSSLSAIGMDSEGKRWIAPINWMEPCKMTNGLWDMIKSIKRIK